MSGSPGGSGARGHTHDSTRSAPHILLAPGAAWAAHPPMISSVSIGVEMYPTVYRPGMRSTWTPWLLSQSKRAHAPGRVVL